MTAARALQFRFERWLDFGIDYRDGQFWRKL